MDLYCSLYRDLNGLDRIKVVSAVEERQMFLLQKRTQNLIEILSTQELFDPFVLEVMAQSHGGQELQQPELFLKADLTFPSGEELPRCWVDPDYRHLYTKPLAMATAT